MKERASSGLRREWKVAATISLLWRIILEPIALWRFQADARIFYSVRGWHGPIQIASEAKTPVGRTRRDLHFPSRLGRLQGMSTSSRQSVGWEVLISRTVGPTVAID